MLKNYLKIAVRHLAKNRAYAVINILGLAVGMACCGIIYLFVQDELSYDDFHSDVGQLYQVLYHSNVGYDFAQLPPPIGIYTDELIPEVAAVVKMMERSVSVDIDDELGIREFEEQVTFADSTLFEIFDLSLLAGNANTALHQPNALLVSQTVAERLFNTLDVQGKELYLQGDKLFTIVGVFEDYPDQSHIDFQIVAPYNSQFLLEGEEVAQQLRNALENNWLISHSRTYVKLHEGADPAAVNAQMNTFMDEYAADVFKQGQTFSLAPLQDLHLLYPDVALQPKTPGNMRYVYTFSAIAIVTLLIACFNFINLSTAHSAQRAREVGMRKALGALKSQLFSQYLGESLVITFLAFLLSLVLMAQGLPVLNELTDKELSLGLLWQPWTLVALAGIFLLTGFLGGSYPAFVLTRLHTITSLKGKTTLRPRVFSLRRVLVTFQFTMSITLITGALIIFFQLDYLLNKPLGFDKDQVVSIPIRSNSINNLFGVGMGSISERLTTLEEELGTHPDVVASTLTGGIPGTGVVMQMINYEGQETETPEAISNMPVDYDFLETFGIEVIAGRAFSTEAGSDHLSSFMINETAVREFGWGSPEEAIGKTLTKATQKVGQIIGVVSDFHYNALTQPIGALILDVSVPEFTALSVRVRQGADYQATLDFVGTKWQEFFPEKTFEYRILDEALASSYQNQDRLGDIMGWFAGLAILVSCLGSYGLILFHAKRREKEIGVRKVLGASVQRLVVLLFKEFTLLYGLGLVFSIGIVLWLANQWLADFEYHINLSVFHFVLGGLATLIIIWGTIGYRSYRAATANPIQALRDD